MDVELPQQDEAVIVVEDTEQQKPAAQQSQINVESLVSSDTEGGDNDEADSNPGMKSRKPTRSDLSVKVKKLRNKNKKQEQAIMEKAE